MCLLSYVQNWWLSLCHKPVFCQRIKLVFGTSFPGHAALCFTEILVPLIMRVLPSETLSQTLHLTSLFAFLLWCSKCYQLSSTGSSLSHFAMHVPWRSTLHTFICDSRDLFHLSYSCAVLKHWYGWSLFLHPQPSLRYMRFPSSQNKGRFTSLPSQTLYFQRAICSMFQTCILNSH